MYKNYARLSLIAVLIITAICSFFLKDLKVEYNFEDFFDKSDQDFAFYNKHRAQFGDDNNYFLIGIENDEGVFEEDFLQKIQLLTTRLEEIDEVVSVISPTNLTNKIVTQIGVAEVPFIHLDNTGSLPNDSTLIYSYDDLIGAIFSDDGKSVAIVIETVDLETSEMSANCMQSTYDALDEFDFDKVHYAGKVVAEVVYVDKISKEFVLFFAISSVLIVVFLVIAFRSVWGVIVPLTVVLLAGICSLGIMAASGKAMDVLSVLLPSILFVVGMSDVVHIITKYLDEIRQGHNKISAVKTTFKEVGLATLLTSLTTAIGFITLAAVDIKPIQQFGMFTAIGVVVAFVLAFMVLPAVLVLMKKPKVADKKLNDLFWYLRLHRFFRWIIKFRLQLSIATVVIVILSLVGVFQIRIDAKLIDEVKDGDPLKEDFVYFEHKFSGARPFELAAEITDTNQEVFDYAVIKELDSIQTYLENTYGVNDIVSPVILVKTINRAMNGGVPSYFEIPDEKTYKRIRRLIKKIRKSEELSGMVTADWRLARFRGKMHDLGLQEVQNRKNAFYEHVTSLEMKQAKYTLTGSSLLIDKSNLSLSSNMMEGLAIAFVVIAVIMGILYRSGRVIFIALIPNIIPLLMIAAIMGYFGISLKMSTAIIFTISFGIAVDDTIHFMSKLKLELSKGKSKLYALKRTFLSTGKAIIVTSIILVAGFMMLIASQFKGTFYTGLLVSLTLFFAVLADLILIPILIMYFYKDSKKKN